MADDAWFEDLLVGHAYTFGTAEVTATDITNFAVNFSPYLPLRPAETPRKQSEAAPQALVYALWTRMLHTETSAWPVKARLGQDALRWYSTAHAGDKLSVSLTFVAKEDTGPNYGLVIASHEIMTEDGDLILTLMTRTLVFKRETKPG
jgi:acyl dehydratase